MNNNYRKEGVNRLRNGGLFQGLWSVSNLSRVVSVSQVFPLPSDSIITQPNSFVNTFFKKNKKIFFKFSIDKCKHLCYNVITKEREVTQMKKFKDYFELNKKYEFDPTDLTAIIFLVASVLGIFTEINITPLFLMGSVIGLVFCLACRRLNLIILNGSLLVLNLVNLCKMF